MTGQINLGGDWEIVGTDGGNYTVEHTPTGNTYTLQSDGTFDAPAVDADAVTTDREATKSRPVGAIVQRDGSTFHADGDSFISSGGDFSAVVQSAVDAISAGQAVVIRDDMGTVTVSSQIQLATDVTLRGETSKVKDGGGSQEQTVGTRLVAADSLNADIIADKSGAKGCRVENIFIDGNRANQTSGNGIVLDGEKSAVAHTQLKNIQNDAIQIKGQISDVNRCKGFNVSRNFVRLLAPDSIIRNLDATADEDVVYVDFANNLIKDSNLFGSTNSKGLFLDTGANSCTLSNIRAENNSSDGIAVDASVINILGARVFNNGEYGIRLQSAAKGAEASSCHSYDNSNSGILVSSPEKAVISGGVYKNNGGAGIELFDAVGTTISGGVQCFDSQGTSTQAIGVDEKGSSDYTLLDGANLRGNGSSSHNVDATNSVVGDIIT